MPHKLLICLITFFLSLIAIGCAQSEKSKNLDSWIGEYKYEEQPIKAVAGYAMVMFWEFSIEKKNDTCRGILDVNGEQTYMKLLTDITGDSSKLTVTYNSLIEGSGDNMKKGDTLFILSKHKGYIHTSWAKIEPRLAEKPAKECKCFVRGK